MIVSAKSQFRKNPGYEEAISYFLSLCSEKTGFFVGDFGSSTKQSEKSSYILLNPVAILVGFNSGSELLTPKGIAKKTEDPLALIDYLFSKDFCSNTLPCPIVAGYLSYELGEVFETVTSISTDRYKIPLFVLCFYSKCVEIPHDLTRDVIITEIIYDEWDTPFWNCEVPDLSDLPLCTSVSSVVKKNVPNDLKPTFLPQSTQRYTEEKHVIHGLEEIENFLSPFSNFSRNDYESAVQNVRERIACGDVYQVNLSQQFSISFLNSPSDFHEALRSKSPSAHSAFMHFGSPLVEEPFSIASSSPELFLKCDGHSLVSSPIKGTRTRYEDKQKDREALNELLLSEKDRAELAMIVDLVRNDMGRIAKIGSVKVLNHARTESLPQVHHLVSDIACELRPDASFLDILRALFPAGSITGAPKIAAMNIISEIEKTTRGVYTGSIGIWRPGNIFEFSVAIRTAVIKNNYLSFQSGGGITFGSDPKSEYEETLAKAKGIGEAINSFSDFTTETL